MIRKKPRPSLSVLRLEDRTVPALVVLGTEGDDIIRSHIEPIPGSDQYHAEILVNGVVAASWAGNTWPFPVTSVFTPDNLFLDALGGNDDIDLGFIRGAEAGGYNEIHGGAGNDTVTATYGHDEVYGDAGADRLNGGVDEDTVFADPTDLALDGGGGVDTLVMGGLHGLVVATPDTFQFNGRTLTSADGTFQRFLGLQLTGSNGADDFELGQFGGFFVSVFAGGGNDIIRSNAGRTNLGGGPGHDQIYGLGFGSHNLFGDDGNDILIAVGTDRANLDGGAGNDLLDGRGVTFSNDSTFVAASGGDGRDTIYGSAGNDFLTGDGGADRIDAGVGSDVVQGDGADLELLLGDGEGEFDRLAMPGVTGSLTVTDSRITAHGHRITATGVEQLEIEGTDGRETINASAFSGFLYAFGLGGRDSITAGSGGSYVDGGDGDDTLTGGSNSDVFFGGAGNDALNGGGGDDQLSGGVGIDVLNGGAGFDVLFGEEGSDMLDGGADDDYLDGGADIDVLLGGSGADVFVMDASAPVWFLEQFLWDFNAAQGDSVFDPNNP